MRGGGMVRRQANRLPRDVCARCLGRGHWRAQCPVVGYRPGPGETYGEPGETWTRQGETYTRQDGPGFCQQGGTGWTPPGPYNNYAGAQDYPNAGGVQVLARNGKSETYIDITFKGRTSVALLNTGCERSVCPLRLCCGTKITEVKTELFAANATPIQVTGATRLHFQIQDMKVYADVLVSEDIDEFILGYDFLERNNCEWLFTQHLIVINGVSVPLRSRQSKSSVRRIYAREPVIIPPDSSVNVPVRMPFANLRTP